MTAKDISLYILSRNLSQKDINLITDALQVKNYITRVIKPSTKENLNAIAFLHQFWSYDKSMYVKEKLALGQSIHRRYVKTNLQRVDKYWNPLLKDKKLGDITAGLIKEELVSLSKSGLKAETVNQIVRSLTCPLHWAYRNGFLRQDPAISVAYCHVSHQKRVIPSLDTASALFNHSWKNQTSFLANLTSMLTGLRLGEVQALQIQDVGCDGLHVRHSWARLDGLKSTKNGEERFVPIPKSPYQKLRKHIGKNPDPDNPSAFVFYGRTADKPMNSRRWTEDLHKELKAIGCKDADRIVFHS